MEKDTKEQRAWRHICRFSFSMTKEEQNGRVVGSVRCASMHPYLPRMALGLGKQVIEIDLSSLSPTNTLSLEQNVLQISYTEREEVSVVALEDSSVWRVDTRLQCALLVLDPWMKAPARNFLISTVDNMAFVAEENRTTLFAIETWKSDSRPTQKVKPKTDFSQPISAMFMNNRLKIIFLGHTSGKAKGYDVSTLKKLHTLTIPARDKSIPSAPITSIYQGSSNLVVIGSRQGSLAVWNWPTDPKSKAMLLSSIHNEVTGPIQSAMFVSAHTTLLAYAGDDHRAYLWHAGFKDNGTSTLIPTDESEVVSAMLGHGIPKKGKITKVMMPSTESCISFVLDAGADFTDGQQKIYLDIAIIAPVPESFRFKEFFTQNTFVTDEMNEFEGEEYGVIYLDGNDICRGSLINGEHQLIGSIPSGFQPIQLAANESLDDIIVLCHKPGTGRLLLRISEGSDVAAMPGRAIEFAISGKKHYCVLSPDGNVLTVYFIQEGTDTEDRKISLPHECFALFPGAVGRDLLLTSEKHLFSFDVSSSGSYRSESFYTLDLLKGEQILQVQWQKLKGFGTFGAVLSNCRLCIIDDKMQVVVSALFSDTAFQKVGFGLPRLTSILWAGPALLMCTQSAILQLTWDGKVQFVSSLPRGGKQKLFSTLVATSTDRIFTLCTFSDGYKAISSKVFNPFQSLVWGWLTFKMSNYGDSVNLASEIQNLLSRYEPSHCTVSLLEELDKHALPDLALLLAKMNTNIPLRLALKYAVHAKKFNTAYHIIHERYEKSFAYPRIVRHSEIYNDFVSLGKQAVVHGQFKVARNCFRLTSCTELELAIDICSGDFESTKDAIECSEEDDSFELSAIVMDASKFLLSGQRVADWELKISTKVDWTSKGLHRKEDTHLLQGASPRLGQLDETLLPFYYEVALKDADSVLLSANALREQSRAENDGFLEDTVSWAGANMRLLSDPDEVVDLMGGAVGEGDDSSEDGETSRTKPLPRLHTERKRDLQRLDIDLQESSDEDEVDILTDLGLLSGASAGPGKENREVNELDPTSLYKGGIRLAEEGDLEEAANLFAKCVKLLANAEHVAGKDRKITQCMHYRVWTRFMTAIRESDLEGDVQESARLLRYASTLKLEPNHRLQCMIDAAVKNMEVGNNKFASDKAHYLLGLLKSQKKGKHTSQLQDVLDHCNESGIYDSCIPQDENLFAFMTFSLEASPTELEEKVTEILMSF